MLKVAVAMSGGVDSSVAAALLHKEGHEVIGLTMQIVPSDIKSGGAGGSGGCYEHDAVTAAKRVADRLGIAHYAVDLRDIFAQGVITRFCREYTLGRTPNPCIWCNQLVKFGALRRRAGELGAHLIATGHYARIEKETATGRYLLKKGRDRSKDQSYFLYTLTQEQLGHSRFPLGEFTKAKVRQIAQEMGLPVADRPESQEICFIPDNDYARFLEKYIGDKAGPGPVIDTKGSFLGEHRGIIFYTVGQRRGLGISAREPLYVVAINREKNAIIVGSKSETYGTGLTASELNWIAIEAPKQPFRVRAKIRYLHKEAGAMVTPLGEDKVQVKFDEPQMAITPGQAVVFYDGDSVIGGGLIEEVRQE